MDPRSRQPSLWDRNFCTKNLPITAFGAVCAICIGLLLVAYQEMPMGYYRFLRFAITGLSVLFAIRMRGTPSLLVISIAFAILYQPLFPIFMKRSTWEFANGLTMLAICIGFCMDQVRLGAESSMRELDEKFK